MTPRSWWKFAAAFCILSLLASCSSIPTPQAAREPLRVEFSQWWGDYTLIIAQERGLFEQYGVNVEPVYYEVYSNSLSDLASGQLDGGLVNIGDALNVSAHADVSIVAAYDDGGPNAIVAIPAIHSINDLKGKRMGVPLGSSYEFFIIQMLGDEGLKPDDVSFFDYDPAEVPNALGRDIDAGLTWEPYTSLAQKKGNLVVAHSDSDEMLGADVIVFRRSIVETRPDDVRAFLKAWFEAVEFRQQNPQAARQIIANYLGLPLSNVELESPVKLLGQTDNLTLFENNPSGNAPSLENISMTNADFLIRLGTLTRPPDLSLILNGSLLH